MPGLGAGSRRVAISKDRENSKFQPALPRHYGSIFIRVEEQKVFR